jgi:hypothetical protein
MSGQLDRARLRDPVLHPIADKVETGVRLTPAEGLALSAPRISSASARWPSS